MNHQAAQWGHSVVSGYAGSKLSESLGMQASVCWELHSHSIVANSAIENWTGLFISDILCCTQWTYFICKSTQTSVSTYLFWLTHTHSNSVLNQSVPKATLLCFTLQCYSQSHWPHGSQPSMTLSGTIPGNLLSCEWTWQLEWFLRLFQPPAECWMAALWIVL